MTFCSAFGGIVYKTDSAIALSLLDIAYFCSVITKDWIHADGHSQVSQILLHISCLYCFFFERNSFKGYLRQSVLESIPRMNPRNYMGHLKYTTTTPPRPIVYKCGCITYSAAKHLASTLIHLEGKTGHSIRNTNERDDKQEVWKYHLFGNYYHMTSQRSSAVSLWIRHSKT